jgi:hypothetical protein
VQGAGSARSIALTVEYALPDGAYRIVLDRESASSESLGIVRVVDGKGSWAGTAPASSGKTSLVLVDDTGERLCSANLPVT